jgi:hypothetical protein
VSRQWVATIRDVPTQQLLCMRGGFNHPFEPISRPVKQGQWGRRINARCTRCGKERVQIKNIYDRTAVTYYETPAWHVKIEEPYDSYDVTEEIARRLNNPNLKVNKQRRLKAV